jgi:hypothetical protein
MILGRLIRSVHGERSSIIRPTRVTKVFVTGDVVSLLLQGNAAGLLGKDKTRKVGESIIIAGLFLQIILFGFFCFVAVVFHRRFVKDVPRDTEERKGVPWQQGLWTLYACSALIMIRSIFRVIEYIGGTDGYLLSHEWPAYIFDAILMFLVQLIFMICFSAVLNFKKGNAEDYGHILQETNSQRGLTGTLEKLAQPHCSQGCPVSLWLSMLMKGLGTNCYRADPK